MQFVEIDQGQVQTSSPAPFLDYEPLEDGLHQDLGSQIFSAVSVNYEWKELGKHVFGG